MESVERNGFLRRAVGRPVLMLRDALARGLIALRVSPDVLTFLGLPATGLAAVLLAGGLFRWGALVVAVAGILDILDGAVARLADRRTSFGAFFDSTIDRYSDILLFGGLMVHYVRGGSLTMVLVTLAALAGALVTSYSRARAECFIESCKVGLVERGERIAAVIVGALSGHVTTALWMLAVLTNLTVLVRIHHTRRELAGRPAPPRRGARGFLYHVLFWDYERSSLPYDVACLAGVLFIVLVKL